MHRKHTCVTYEIVVHQMTCTSQQEAGTNLQNYGATYKTLMDNSNHYIVFKLSLLLFLILYITFYG